MSIVLNYLLNSLKRRGQIIGCGWTPMATFTPAQHGWCYVLSRKLHIGSVLRRGSLECEVTAATGEQTETSLFCHAQISVIMCNYHRCRFSGRCKGVRKGLVEEFSAVWSAWQIDKVHAETWAGMNTSDPKDQECLSHSDVSFCSGTGEKKTHDNFWRTVSQRRGSKVDEKVNSLRSSRTQARVHFHSVYARSSFLLWDVTPGWA